MRREMRYSGWVKDEVLQATSETRQVAVPNQTEKGTPSSAKIGVTAKLMEEPMREKATTRPNAKERRLPSNLEGDVN